MKSEEKKKEVHYGQEVQKRLEEYGMTKAKFARRINKSRSDVYDIFKRQYIDLQLLETISGVLKYDFIHKHSL